jgi:hypothetical protein
MRRHRSRVFRPFLVLHVPDVLEALRLAVFV